MGGAEDEESLLSSEKTEIGMRMDRKRHGMHHPPRDPVVLVVVGMVMVLIFLLTLVYWLMYVMLSKSFLFHMSEENNTHGYSFADAGRSLPLPLSSPCDTISDGYQCATSLSHNWGQYSPYYRVDSKISNRPPKGCTVTFTQLLSRHGARFPTTDKSVRYDSTITKIRTGATNFSGTCAFLKDYVYDLGADDLTSFGEQELINSGIDFFWQYESLAEGSTPFIRASGEDRVIESAKKWSEGFHKAKIASRATNDTDYPYHILEVSEAQRINNTLNHGLCTIFERSTTGGEAQGIFGKTFLPSITARLNGDLQGVDLTDVDTIGLMDMCPYSVVAGTTSLSDIIQSFPINSRSDPYTNPFCALFTHEEWASYDYYQTLGKYYGFGPGAPLGPTQGVGFVNELIARLTSSPVQDRTSVNHTQASDSATFPLGRTVYADFSHDNDMTSIFAALGLLEQTPVLSKTDIMTIEEMEGYSASRTVPFGGRIVIEKLVCDGSQKEMVRMNLNARILPLKTCGGDAFGRCTLDRFVESLAFARSGGKWDECFAATTKR